MMLERWLTNLGLALIAAWLGVLAMQDVQQQVSSGRLTDLAPERVQSIALQRSAGPLIRLERRDHGWSMRAPIEAPADEAAVGRLLNIAHARVSRVLPADATAAGRLGLDPPRVRLTLDGLTLNIGESDPVGNRRYVMIGDLVQLIDDDQLPWLLAPPEQFLSRRLLPADFSPGLGSIDGRPLSADTLATLVDVVAERVEPIDGELGGRILAIQSADGDQQLRFLVAEGGTRWTRLDQRLSYWLTQPPLAERDEDAFGEPGQLPAPGLAPAGSTDNAPITPNATPVAVPNQLDMSDQPNEPN
ncbi:DUF4340 domain-containing protein [Halochromatium roseum]|uniref:DUF4340 domain-containing protein n=1 Tax=Halochromatium roseum TaxID=391920 RepID=UPI001913518C|nr:DUF4340 domain-containing protein [Halochromatium roseum]MBK5940257.1 hypothetical protein [Halochromatium roseum]